MKKKIYRVKYSFLCGDPNNRHRTECMSDWYVSKKRMYQCAFWKIQDSPQLDFKYTIEESTLDIIEEWF